MRAALLMAGAALVPALTFLAPAQAQQVAEASPVEEIIVTGRVQRLYRVEETSIGKMPANILDIPQAVQVINEEMIRDMGARNVIDLYRNISGVSYFTYGGVTFRGFRQEQNYYDGMRGDPFIGFAVPQLFNIERVEVLKGPAGMLYGPAAPGGTINYVTKGPTEEFRGDVRLTAGNYGRIGGSAELSGPADAAGRFTYRVGAFYEKMDSFRIGAGSDSKIGDASLGIKLTDDIKLTLQAIHFDQALPANRLRGIPVSDAGVYLGPISWNHNEPTDYSKLTSNVLQAKLDARITDNIRLDAGIRWFKAEELQNYHEPRGTYDSNRDGIPDMVRREFRDQRRKGDGLALAANLIADAETGSIGHKILFGADWYREDSLLLSRIAPTQASRGPVPDASLTNRVYGLTSGASYAAYFANRPYTPTDTRAEREGIYLQDQISLTEQWDVIAGVRYDHFTDTNRVNGTDYADGDYSWRAGLIYKPVDDVSVYASWSTSFEPQSVANQDSNAGGPFDPITGKQVEAGVKTALLGGRIQANGAVYRIVRENMLQTDTSKPPVNGVNPLSPIGEVTSKGFELDLSTDITPDWVFTANYGYNDTKITGTVPGQSLTNAVGNRFANAPRNKVGFWTRYQVQEINTAFAFGGEYVSQRVSLGGQTVKPYTIFDASIITDLGFAEAMFRVKNIFDKEYAASGFTLHNGHFPGEPRTWFIELRKQF
ncbi:TonB-dependent siderophore receptor [Niveispirillum sp. BGYR6]|uniref:TonB-dependent siderophore receptor n=1 Tax=Niveispirillum sp. BGYR6 TaxID=2971249 RepID=UPI0022B9BFDA|nr:TonB-dependent siderophore receptor [Niveispirillum sp. BGYR6]MDG5495572.1 TonB-dependent siderophore receptor [Niveispirillum sp. BGYR6]